MTTPLDEAEARRVLTYGTIVMGGPRSANWRRYLLESGWDRRTPMRGEPYFVPIRCVMAGADISWRIYLPRQVRSALGGAHPPWLSAQIDVVGFLQVQGGARALELCRLAAPVSS